MSERQTPDTQFYADMFNAVDNPLAAQQIKDFQHYAANTPANEHEVVDIPKPHELVEKASEESIDPYADMTAKQLLDKLSATRKHKEKLSRIDHDGRIVRRKKNVEYDKTTALDVVEALGTKLAEANFSDDGLLAVLSQIEKRTGLTGEEATHLIDRIYEVREAKEAEADVLTNQENEAEEIASLASDEVEPDQPLFSDQMDIDIPQSNVEVSNEETENDDILQGDEMPELFDQDKDDDEELSIDTPEDLVDEPVDNESAGDVLSNDEIKEDADDIQDDDTEIIAESIEPIQHEAESLDSRWYEDGKLKPYKTSDGKKLEITDIGAPEVGVEIKNMVVSGNLDKVDHIYLCYLDSLQKSDMPQEDIDRTIQEITEYMQPFREMAWKNKHQIELMRYRKETSDRVYSNRKYKKLTEWRTHIANHEFNKLVQQLSGGETDGLSRLYKLRTLLGKGALKSSGLIKPIKQDAEGVDE